MKKRVLFMIVFCLVFAQTNKIHAETVELPQYWETAIARSRGVVVVVHGLNVKPSKMGEPQAEGTLVKLLLDSGYNVYRVTLKGHCGPIENMRNTTGQDWLDDAYVQYCQAKTIANEKKLPLYLLGFSLGALVYEVLMHEETPIPVKFERAVHFSPAVAIKPIAKKILWLQPFKKDSSIIKSVSPEAYRAQRGVSMAAYKAVFKMEETLCSDAFRNCNIDTIVFIDKDDEMISLDILRKRIQLYGLGNWTVYVISNAGASIKPHYHHLLIDGKCVSNATWQFISDTILKFFS